MVNTYSWQRLPPPPGDQQIATGPMLFGDEYDPAGIGVYICRADALMLAAAIRGRSIIPAAEITGELADLLESCAVDP